MAEGAIVQAAEQQATTTTTTTEIPVVYYDGFDETAHKNRYVDDDDMDMEESDGFIFDFNPVGKSSAHPVHPIHQSEPVQSIKRKDSWDQSSDKGGNNNGSSMASASISLEVEKLETTADSVAYELRVAIESNHLRKVQELFEKHGGLVDPNYIYTDTYWTPLMFAASMANLEMTKYLIEKGADPEYTDGQLLVSRQSSILTNRPYKPELFFYQIPSQSSCVLAALGNSNTTGHACWTWSNCSLTKDRTLIVLTSKTTSSYITITRESRFQ